MSPIQVRHTQHAQHIKVVRFEFVGNQQVFERLVEALNLVFELGGRELSVEIIGLLAGLLHGRLSLSERLLLIGALITAANRRMICRQVLALLGGRQRRDAQGGLSGEDRVGEQKTNNKAEQNADNRKEEVVSSHSLFLAMTYLTHRSDLSDHAMARTVAAREGCKIVAGGRRPPESDLGWAPRRGARLLMITLKQDLAPLHGANW